MEVLERVPRSIRLAPKIAFGAGPTPLNFELHAVALAHDGSYYTGLLQRVQGLGEELGNGAEAILLVTEQAESAQHALRSVRHNEESLARLRERLKSQNCDDYEPLDSNSYGLRDCFDLYGEFDASEHDCDQAWEAEGLSYDGCLLLARHNQAACLHRCSDQFAPLAE